jgi:RNA 2',3'-cyclic 3'-phosphodiesterase
VSGRAGPAVSDTRARLFVALELPAEVRRGLAVWTREHTAGMERLRPVAPDSLHVTLCFLGARPVAEREKIAAACRAVVALPAPELVLGDALWLPPRRPRVLTVELAEQEPRLAAVQSALAQALADGGFYEPESRPFLAHVTVARVAREARPRRGELPARERAHFTADRVTLYQSRLGRGPAHYEALSTVELPRH